jgi:hypothetical protein
MKENKGIKFKVPGVELISLKYGIHVSNIRLRYKAQPVNAV